MRGYYGNFEKAACLECGDEFTKKQPGQRYCDVVCQMKVNKRKTRLKARAR